MENNNFQGKIDPYYTSGDFFLSSQGNLDSEYKVEQLSKIIRRNIDAVVFRNGKVADVGCGTGKTTFLLQEMLTQYTDITIEAYGYDVHPYVNNIAGTESVHFSCGDFCRINHQYVFDLVVLFDVIEHIIDPISFIKDIAKSCRTIAFHIPLDDSYFTWIRDLPKLKISKPGHLLNLDASSALNLLAYSGLRVVSYEYSPVYKSSSSNKSLIHQIMNQIRGLSFLISPFLTQKYFAGVGLLVLAVTTIGLSDQQEKCD